MYQYWHIHKLILKHKRQSNTKWLETNYIFWELKTDVTCTRNQVSGILIYGSHLNNPTKSLPNPMDTLKNPKKGLYYFKRIYSIQKKCRVLGIQIYGKNTSRFMRAEAPSLVWPVITHLATPTHTNKHLPILISCLSTV